VAKAPSRYSRFLLQLKLHALETVGTLFVLALLTDFALKELHPIVVSIWHTLHSP
jgi:hypothetical protein